MEDGVFKAKNRQDVHRRGRRVPQRHTEKTPQSTRRAQRWEKKQTLHISVYFSALCGT